jgi:phosphoenolpyruvate-protein phosphotransferase
MTVVRSDLHGIAASPGVVVGPWKQLTRAPSATSAGIARGSAAEETERLRRAAKESSKELRALAASVRDAGHPEEAAIFLAQAAMALDPAILDPAAAQIEAKNTDAASAILAAGAAAAAEIARVDDELLRARASDVRDVADRIARRVAGVSEQELLPAPAIVVAEDLPPSLTATLPRDRILGIALEGSSATAHAAILARAYGIPAVVGVKGLLNALESAAAHAELAIDGSSGEIVVDPDTTDRSRFETLAAASRDMRSRDEDEAGLPAQTRDGKTVTLLANIGTPAEADGAVALGARGVGLFRTEFLFLERDAPPSEDEQTTAYRQVVESFAGQPITIRLLDVGGDKPIPYLRLPREDNPFLGVRALRLAEQHPELFRAQLRAAYRAAVAGPVKVMAPMIADATDTATFLALAADARMSLDREGISRGEVALGVMVEIPAAVLAADSFFGELQFVSLGTNDLLQYMLAADRGNAALERYRDALHPALLRLIRLSVDAAERARIELSVCGEMAGDPAAALALVGLGVRQLSMAPSSLASVRRAIRAVDFRVVTSAVGDALGDRSAAEVRARFATLVPGM